MVDSAARVCVWRCVACGQAALGRAEPPPCACGVERSWVMDGPSEREPEAGPGGASVRADQVEPDELPRLRTGARALDALLGGGPAAGSAVLVYGKRGAGKSRLTYRFASAHRCLVAHPEMARNVARAVAESTGANLARVHLLGTLDGWQAEAELVGARAVVLDSLAAAVDPVAELRAAQTWARSRSALVYCIAHATKAGDHRGSTELSHWADYEWRLVPDVGGARVEVVKTRLEPAGAVVVALG